MLTESECFSGTNIPKSFYQEIFRYFSKLQRYRNQKDDRKELDKMIESATKNCTTTCEC